MANTILIDDPRIVKLLDGFSTTELDSFTASTFTAPEGGIYANFDHCMDEADNLCICIDGRHSQMDGITSTELDNWNVGVGAVGMTTDNSGNFILMNGSTAYLYDAFDGTQIDSQSIGGQMCAWGEGALYAESSATAKKYDGFTSSVLDTVSDEGDGDIRGVTWDGTCFYRSVRNVTNTARQYDGFTDTRLDDLSLGFNAWGIEIDRYTQRIAGEAGGGGSKLIGGIGRSIFFNNPFNCAPIG